MKIRALAGVAQWIECWPVKRKVTGSIPGPDPQLWTCKKQLNDASLIHHMLMFLSLSFSLPSPLSEK